MRTRANNLRDAIKNLDPKEALRIEELHDFYVERDNSPIRHLLIDLEEAHYQKFLFTGHRGTGKSTELARLEKDLQLNYEVIRFSVHDYLDMHDLDYRDVILAMFFSAAEFITKHKTLKGKIKNEVLSLITDLWSFGQKIEKESSRETTRGTEAEAAAGGILSTVLSLGARFKSENSTRESIRSEVDHRLRELLNGLDTLAREIERLNKKPILFIIEDLDKTDLARADTIFYQHAQSLTAPKVMVIYTFPIALRHNDNYPQIKHFFTDVHELPNLKLQHKDGTTDNDSFAALRSVISKRVLETCFEEGVLDYLVGYSSGIPRILIQLTRSACVEARVNQHQSVSMQDAEEAVAAEKRDYQYILTSERIKVLKNVKSTKNIENTDVYRELLHNLSIIHYSNHTAWYDLNPLVRDLVDADTG